MAHTTQFTAPGWRYLDSRARLPRRQPRQRQLRLAALADHQRLQHHHRDDRRHRRADLHLHRHRRPVHRHVHVWCHAASGNPDSTTSCAAPTSRRRAARFTLTLQPGYVYTLTTTTGQGKGTATSPAPGDAGAAVQRHLRQLRRRPRGQLPQDMQGSFEIAGCGAGRAGRCVRQMSPSAPIIWDAAQPTRTRCSATSAGATTRSPPTSCWNRPATSS